MNFVRSYAIVLYDGFWSQNRKGTCSSRRRKQPKKVSGRKYNIEEHYSSTDNEHKETKVKENCVYVAIGHKHAMEDS